VKYTQQSELASRKLKYCGADVVMSHSVMHSMDARSYDKGHTYNVQSIKTEEGTIRNGALVSSS
jgi:hypothetical protein